ncbi:MAG: hypothetical protein ACI92G_000554 [Candidatus Pelagisphaera sp.]|jgi:hypothetical protein
MSLSKRFRTVLRKRFPRVLARIENAEPLGGDVDAVRALTGFSSNWEALVQRWLDGVELKPNSVVALTGFGDGSHVRALLDRLPQGAYVFCVEEKVAVFRAIVEESEGLVGLLEDPRFFLGLGELDQDCFESLSRLPTLEVQDASPLIFAPIYNRAPEYYGAFFAEFARSFDYWRKLFGTNVTASGKWQKNTFANLPSLIAAPDIGELKDAFCGCSIILVSAGPSLDESIGFIEENLERCIVVAVNSSYRALRNAGITPHFVLAADPYQYTDKGFEGVACDETRLICPFIVCPNVVRRFEGRTFTWSQNNLLASNVRLRLGLEFGSQILEMGTVSACIFDVAEIFGCSRIFFVGQDLAAKTDGQLHAADSFYSDLYGNKVAIDNCRLMPGNTIDRVPVEEKLFVYLKTFEQLAKERGLKLELVNTSHFGARIEGIPFVRLEEVSEGLAREETVSWKTGIDRASQLLKEAKKRSLGLDGELERMSNFGRQVCALALKGALVLETGINGKGIFEQPQIDEGRTIRGELDALFESDSNLHQVLNDGSLKYELTLYARGLQRVNAIEDALAREGEDSLEYFWAIAEGAFSFLSANQLDTEMI